MESTLIIGMGRNRNYLQYFIMALACLVATSCTEKETPGGVKYTVIKSGDGVEPQYGQFMVLNMTLKDSKDSVWFNSKDTGNPVVMPVPDASMFNNEGEYGVFKAMTKGDSVTFKMPANIVFLKTRGRPVPKNVDPLSLFQFNVGLIDVWSQEQANQFKDRVMEERERLRAKNDLEAISNYLAEKNIENAVNDSSGIIYVVKKEGKGEKAKPGQTAYIHYTGYLLDGTIFDTSLASVAKANNFNNGGRNEPYAVVVNTGGVIRGWDEMIMLMNKGMQVTVYVPSALGYGSQSPGGPIPPNAIMIFDMELVDIK
jgi:FKBP-type peptidyl-prolyl cis-trans isomerase FkpA